MSKNIFTKYFMACISVILISFVFLSTAMTVFALRYSGQEKHDLYMKNADNIVDVITKHYTDAEYEAGIITLCANTLEADIFITDQTGAIIALSPQRHTHFLKSKVPEQIMDQLNNGQNISQVGKLDGMYDEQCDTEAVPIKLFGGQIVGAVFISSRSANLLKYFYDIFRIFIYSAVLILAFASAAVYFVTARLVRPLKEMSRAVKSFANGDFSARVPVRDKDEVGELAAAFNNMADSLSSLEDMRRSFVANVSHELKTPMTTISGFIDGILDGTIPPERQSHYLNIVSDEVKRLSRLVHSLLDIARLEAGEMKINMAQFELTEIISRVIIGFEYQLESKKLDVRGFDANHKIMVYSDPDTVHRVVYNLFENAVKFAGEGGFIEISLAENGKRVYVSVKNSGMGIPEKDLPHVFERFYKTDKSRSQDKKGVGLGLYIVKSMLNRMGEDIVVRSAEGQFCEFMFTLRKGGLSRQSAAPKVN